MWATKHHYPYLTKEVKTTIIEHIRQNAKSKGIIIDTLNGPANHLHCLFKLDAEMSIAKAMQLIKGESAFWINKNNITPIKFEWANEYYAASVSETALNSVRGYIINQEEHHRKKTFMEEYEEFIAENQHLIQG